MSSSFVVMNTKLGNNLVKEITTSLKSPISLWSLLHGLLQINIIFLPFKELIKVSIYPVSKYEKFIDGI